MTIRSVARTLTAIAASSALLIASESAAWAQHAGGGAHGGAGGGGFHGGAVGHGGGGFHGGYGYHGYGGYGYHGYGYRGYGYRGYGWGWRPGWGWWWWGWGVPLGAYLAVLPWYYSTVWWDGVPYYYANGDYYIWNGTASQYEQVQPPPEVMQQGPGGPPASQELYAYPMHGQPEDQQARDKNECRQWASGQVAGGASAPNAAPGAPGPAPGSAPPAAAAGYNGAPGGQDYLRAEAACLEARGYSVK